MKGLLKGILIIAFFVQSAFSSAPITTNSFVRHDVGFSAPPLDFTAGVWKAGGDSMIAAVTRSFSLPQTNAPQTKLEIVAIGANSEPNGAAAVIYEAPSATGPISVGDIDGDGANDIVYGARTNVVVRLNTSSAASPAFDAVGNLQVGLPGIVHGLALVDLDGDGKLDIVYATGAIYAVRNQSIAGTISFDEPITIYTNSASFQVADLDGDGRADLEVRPTDMTVGSYLRNTSSRGAISFAQSSAGLSRGNLIDVNGDSEPDHLSLVIRIFVPHGEPATALSISTNSSAVGTVAFARSVSVSVDAPPLEPPSKIRGTLPSFRSDFVGADFNQDGRVDLVWVNYTNSLIFLENLNATPLYLNTWASGTDVRTLLYPYEPLVTDMNHDGKPDLVVGGGSTFVSIFENRIEPIPELVVFVDATDDLGATVNLSAAAYAADVTAVDYFEDGKLITTATSANGFRAQYQPTSAGTHSITARATAGPNTGLISKAAGVRVRDLNLGRIVGFGSGTVSSTTLLIYDTGRAFGVGSNARGQLADPFYNTPHTGFVEISAPTNSGGWKSLSAGLSFTIGLTASNRVFSWGANDLGQLGRETITSTNPVPAEVIFNNGGAPIEKIGAGRDFAVALDANGDLFAWGTNAFGSLGRGDTAQRTRPTKIKKPEGVARWTDVSVGMLHVLALDDAGQLYGWGWNFWGQAAQPRTNVAVLEPARIELPSGETTWTNINAGVVASYAQTASGRTYRWGDYLTDAGEVVDDAPELFAAPDGSGGFRTVGAGAPLNVGLGNDGNAYVWGGGILAPTGLGDQTAVTNPTILPLPTGVKSWSNIAVAIRRAAALADDGRVFVWGFDFSDALGTGTDSANIPAEPCLPFQNCASNYPPAVKIVHPVYGDLFPADGSLRFEIAADDFDGVVGSVKIVREDTVLALPGTFTTTTKQTEVARLSFGETTASVPIPSSGSIFGTSFFAVAYDNSGLVTTGATVRLVFPTQSLGTYLTLTNAAPTNEFTGWREIYASFRNNSSFFYGSVSAVLSNVPAGVTVRNNTLPSGTGVETITNVYGVGPGETATFRIEYKLADGVDGAQIIARFIPGPAIAVGSATGELQPLTMTILTNGIRMLEFDHLPGEQHTMQFTDTLTNWLDAGGFLETKEGKMLWLDGGPPASPKLPAFAPRRFYRVIRKP